MRLMCTQDYDARDTRISVEFCVRDGNYNRIFQREMNIQTKDELLGFLKLMMVALEACFIEVEDEPAPEEAQAEL